LVVGELHKIVGKMYVEHDDEDVPGAGAYYCVECAKYFVDLKAQQSHNATKQHKRRVKMINKEPAYTLAEAEAAVGFTTMN
jgi:bud site selection protein 20